MKPVIWHTWSRIMNVGGAPTPTSYNNQEYEEKREPHNISSYHFPLLCAILNHAALTVAPDLWSVLWTNDKH
eukprot:scaffold350610_cov116-Cyclotella_meneghiniana.AAC.2